jgi:cobalt/nickel transport system permease protein
MHIHFLDPFKAIDSPIHELDPRVKLVLSLAFILTTALIPHGAWPVYILLLAIIFSVIILSRLGFIFVLKRSALALPFVLAALPMIFTIKGDPLAQFMLGNWQLTISLPGLERFISITLKSWISYKPPSCWLLLPVFQICSWLCALSAFPPFGICFWVDVAVSFVLADEALRLMRARLARSGETDNRTTKPGGSLVWRAQVTGGMAGSLFLRALERSDRIFNAMISRGYDGEVRTLPLPPLRTTQWMALFGGLGLLILLLLLSVLL